MKKQLAIILSIITAISLCGCDVKENQNSSDSISDNSSESSATNESSAESSTESVPAVSEPEEPQPTFLVGLDGGIITTADIISAKDTKGETEPSRLTPEDFREAEVKGAYISMPSGICRTSIDNADAFDGENYIFTDVPEETKHDFIRVMEGDEICGFTVKSAVSRFTSAFANGVFGSNDDGTPLHGKDLVPEIYFTGGELELEGKAELTGYIAIQPEDAYGIGAGTIKFIPSDCNVNLPVLHYDFRPFDGWICRPVGELASDEDIFFTNEYGSLFRLGSADSAAVDLSGVPGDGSYVKAKITVEKITALCNLAGTTLQPLAAEITEIKIL